MLGMKEFFYSILRHWRLFAIVTVILFFVGSGAYFSANRFSGSKDVSERISYWYNAEKYYISVLKYTGVGNGEVESQVVRDAYLSNFYGLDFKQYLKDNYFSEVDSLEYIESMLSISTGGVNNCAVIEFVYYNETETQKVQDVIKDYVESLKPRMSNYLGEHKLFLTDSSVNEVSEKSLSDKLTPVKDYLSTMDDFPKNGVKAFSFKKMLVYGILASLACDFLLAVFILIGDGIHSSIYNLNLFSERKNFGLIGDFSFLKLRSGIDRFFYKLLINRNWITEKGAARMAGYRLRNIKAFGNTFVITGGIDISCLNRLKAILERENKDLTFICRALPDINADNLEEWESGVPIIYVVERFKDSQQEMKSNIDFYSNIGFLFIGSIFV